MDTSDITVRDTPAFSTVRTILPRAERDGAAVRLVSREQPRYEPIRPLGSGGMGEVTLVLDRDIGRLVAVKRLLPDFDAGAALRFVEEIRILGQIDHPNIVPIYDVGVGDDGRYFFVMKYLEGETLATVIQGLRDGDPDYHRRYPMERRTAIFIDILRALSAAHARGVLHRDIKPANVMIGQRGEVTVMDWGIAKSVGAADGCAPGTLVGTPSYMSPEQARGSNDEVDERSDLYGATVLFHELISLHHYLEDRSSSSVETLVGVIADETSFHQLVAAHHPGQPMPPAELLRLVARGLEKDPGDRFQSAEEMIEELESLLAARAALGQRVDSARRRLHGLAAIAGAHLHLAILVLVMIAWRVRAALS
jgi:serine/threonine-protein kinase